MRSVEQQDSIGAWRRPKMRRRVGPWLVAAFLLIASSASADEVSDLDRFRLWANCAPIGLFVGVSISPTTQIHLEEADIETTVRSRLRGARIYNDISYSNLEVGVDVVGRAVHLEMAFVRQVEVLLPFWAMQEEIEPLRGFTDTWRLGRTGTHGDDPGFLLSVMAQMTDKFIDEYLRVNADACE